MTERQTLSLLAGADLLAHRLVKIDANGDAVYMTATDTDVPIGVNELNVKDTEPTGIKPINAQGTIEMTASGAITLGADVYADADGKVSALPVGAGDYRKIGIAMQAASGDGSIIEVLPYDYITVTTVT
jgi:hypothetical protein